MLNRRGSFDEAHYLWAVDFPRTSSSLRGYPYKAIRILLFVGIIGGGKG
jgi:hypothetical protein